MDGSTKTNAGILYQTVTSFTAEMLSGDELQLPMIRLSPYEIFSNKGDIFSVNIFKKESEQEASEKTIISKLKNIIRDWYITLRLIAIVGMMSVLVYIGIRILISSTADSKAKYKQMLWDWLMATCLIFVMHYIMVFSNMVVDSITEMIDSISVETKVGNNELVRNEQGVEGFLIGVSGEGKDTKLDTKSEKLVKKAYELMIEKGNDATKNYEAYFWSDTKGTKAKDKNSAKVLFWPTDNFISQARIYAQKVNVDDGTENYQYIGFGLVYVVLTVYTVMFIWVYLRRLIYMVFLTLIAPLVALTYPIDKVKDGQAQAFNFWFKEYAYNLLLQPLHLLLYIILIGSAMKFAADNSLYVIVALGFMIPAEKLLKEMFGFKGTTPGSISGLAAGAMIMGATKSLFSRAPKSNPALGKASGNGTDSNDNSSVPNKTKSANPWQDFINKGENNNKPSENNEITDPSAAGFLDLAEDPENMMNFGNNEITDPSAAGFLDLAENPENMMDFGNNNRSKLDNTNNVPQIDDTTNNEEESESNDEEENKKMTRWQALKNTAINNAREKGDMFLNTDRRRDLEKRAIKGIARNAPRIAGGALFGGMGLTAGAISGIVSGDLKGGVRNAAIGGALGYKGGSAMMKNTGDNIISGAKGFIDDFNAEYYSDKKDEYDKKLMDEYEKNWKLNRNNMNVLRRNKIDDAQFKELSEKGISEYLQAGFTDAKDIASAERFAKDNNLGRKDAIDVLQMNKQIAGGNFTNLHDQDKQKWRDDMKKRFGKYTTNQNIIEDHVKKAEGYLESLSSIRSKIQ